ncbi:MAG: PaaI family thioesterase [Anaerolineales bacterium]
MRPHNSDYRQYVEAIFASAPFIDALGVRLLDVGPGWCETELVVRPDHLQQDDFIHAGVQATMADHSSGAAAGSLIAPDETVLTVEFKINLLRPAHGERLFCRAEVIKPGRRITVSESDVYAVQDAERRHVARATVTLAIVENPRTRAS